MDRDLLLNKAIVYWPEWNFARKILSYMRYQRTRIRYLSDSEVSEGERSYASKCRIVRKYLNSRNKKLWETTPGIQRIFDNALPQKATAVYDKLRTDMLFCRLAYGFQAEEYWCFGLEKQTKEERKQWISDLDRYCLLYRLNDMKDAQIFNNKGATYDKFKQYYKRDAVRIKNRSDYPVYLEFIRKHPVFVKKQVYQSMGASVALIDSAEFSLPQMFQAMIEKGEHILEEQIIQSEVMSALNRSSVNTIRCITLNTRHGIEIPYTFLKVGRNGSFVDNGGAGGILAGIDPETGKIITNGYDEYCREYVYHPDTGIRFAGYCFPNWSRMKELCRAMSSQMKNVKCIGWDMALTDQDWVVVEGNGRTQFIGPQIVFKRGIKKELAMLLKDVDMCI